jgi:hypothetical protein
VSQFRQITTEGRPGSQFLRCWTRRAESSGSALGLPGRTLGAESPISSDPFALLYALDINRAGGDIDLAVATDDEV